MESNSDAEQVVVFFKVRPEAITPDNLHNAIFVSTMSDSPISGLFHAVQKVYAPVLSQSKGFDPNLQSLLMQLEAGLGSVIRKTSGGGGGGRALDDTLGGKCQYTF